MNEKKTWLAIGLSAAAILVGYIAYQSVSSPDDDEEALTGMTEDDIQEKIQAAIEELHPIVREDNSDFLDFDYFLKIFEIS